MASKSDGGGAKGESRWFLRRDGFPGPDDTTWGSKEKPVLDYKGLAIARAKRMRKKRKTESDGKTVEGAKARANKVSQ